MASLSTYAPATSQLFTCRHSFNSCHNPMKEATSFISILWVRKLTYKEVNQFAQCHKATKRWKKDSKPHPASHWSTCIHLKASNEI